MIYHTIIIIILYSATGLNHTEESQQQLNANLMVTSKMTAIQTASKMVSVVLLCVHE